MDRFVPPILQIKFQLGAKMEGRRAAGGVIQEETIATH
jgi:hypothetical protein